MWRFAMRVKWIATLAVVAVVLSLTSSAQAQQITKVPVQAGQGKAGGGLVPGGKGQPGLPKLPGLPGGKGQKGSGSSGVVIIVNGKVTKFGNLNDLLKAIEKLG